MINKKILALAVAAAFTTNAFAAVDLDDKDEKGVYLASELVAKATVTDGMVTFTDTNNDANVSVVAGFDIAASATKYVRIDLVNAKFGAADPTLVSTGSITSANVQTGGEAAAFAIFEVIANTGVAKGDTFTLDSPTFTVSATAASTVTYSLYENALDAINKTPNTTYKTVSKTLTSTKAASTGKFAVAQTVGNGKVKALSGDAFKKFNVEGDTTALIGTVGELDTSLVLDGDVSTLNLAGAPTTAAMLIPVTAQVIKFTGDFSFGDWTVVDDGDCTGTSEVTSSLDDGNAVLTTVAVDPTDPIALCVTLDGTTDVAKKSSYSAELVTSKLTNAIGSIIYDTTTIHVPYLTTFSGYNQRIYLLNSGSTPANYTITFAGKEVGVTATAGSGATGTIPAKSMVAVKSSDIVTLAGKTRTSADIEVETASANISATTQIINADGSTDTLVLKAKP